MCLVWPCRSFVDGLSYKCIDVYKKRSKSQNNYSCCLPFLMLLYIMLYIMLAYLMLFVALFNAVCLYDAFYGH